MWCVILRVTIISSGIARWMTNASVCVTIVQLTGWPIKSAWLQSHRIISITSSLMSQCCRNYHLAYVIYDVIRHWRIAIFIDDSDYWVAKRPNPDAVHLSIWSTGPFLFISFLFGWTSKKMRRCAVRSECTSHECIWRVAIAGNRKPRLGVAHIDTRLVWVVDAEEMTQWSNLLCDDLNNCWSGISNWSLLMNPSSALNRITSSTTTQMKGPSPYRFDSYLSFSAKNLSIIMHGSTVNVVHLLLLCSVYVLSYNAYSWKTGSSIRRLNGNWNSSSVKNDFFFGEWRRRNTTNTEHSLKDATHWRKTTSTH